MTPEPVVSKIERWTRKSGGVNARGEKLIKGKRGGKSSSSNSGPCGKRKMCWYQGRFGRKPAVKKA